MVELPADEEDEEDGDDDVSDLLGRRRDQRPPRKRARGELTTKSGAEKGTRVVKPWKKMRKMLACAIRISKVR